MKVELVNIEKLVNVASVNVELVNVETKQEKKENYIKRVSVLNSVTPALLGSMVREGVDSASWTFQSPMPSSDSFHISFT